MQRLAHISGGTLSILIGLVASSIIPAQAATVCWTAANGSMVCQDDDSGGVAPGAGGIGGGQASGGSAAPSAPQPAPASVPAQPAPYVPPAAPAPVYQAPVQPAPVYVPPAAPAPAYHATAPAPRYAQRSASAGPQEGYVAPATPSVSAGDAPAASGELSNLLPAIDQVEAAPANPDVPAPVVSDPTKKARFGVTYRIRYESI